MSARSKRRRQKRAREKSALDHATDQDRPRMPKIWLVKGPEGSSNSQHQTDVQKIADSRGWSVFRTECVRLAITKGDDAGRLVGFLRRRDADDLYKDMHRGPVAVLFEVPTWVRTSPEAGAALKRMIPIDRFCRYKAFTMDLTDDRASNWSVRFDSWLNSNACDGKGDPRVLPFHIFAMREAKGQSLDLNSAAERRRFRHLHSRNEELVDASEHHWKNGAPHGRDPQFVRNVELPLGHHWDVSKRTGAKIQTPAAVWTVDSHGYVNVYADGSVRKGIGSKRVWSERQSKSQDEVEQRNRHQKF